MIKHLFDGVSHDDRRSHDPLFAGEVHGTERSDALAVAVLSPVLWAVAIGYAAAGVTLVYVACVLAPWGLLLLILAIGVLAAAVLCGSVAFGISRLEEDPA